MEQGTKPQQQDGKGSQGADAKRPKLLVWVGAATAVISLVLGANQLWSLISNRYLHRQQINTLIASAKLQQDAHEYSAAWASLDSAAGLASDRRIPALQEDLAMKWLENIRVHEGETFTDIVKKVEPVLTRGITSETNPARKADLTAHVGWGAFLRSRDGDSSAKPEALYAQAVQLDPKNPYANAMWGHWILWTSRDLPAARNRFADALSSGRERAYVHSLEITALLNNHSDEFEAESLRVANEIRKEGGSLDETAHSNVQNIYLALARDDSRRSKIVAAAPPLEQIETIKWLASQSRGDSYKDQVRTYAVAVMQEAAGEKQAAKAGYQSVLDSAPAYSTDLRRLATLGIARTK